MRPRFALSVLIVTLALLLTGCMRLKADFTISADDEVAVVMDVGLNKQTADQSGTSQDDMCGGQGVGQTGINGTTESYDDGTYVGCRITGTVAIGDMKGEGLTITRADNVYTFTWASGDTGGEAAGMSAAMVSDFRVAVTFPGKVLSHNGSSTVEGTTVTWTSAADLFTSEGLVATGEAKPPLTALLVPILIGLAALALVGALVWYLLARRKKATAAAAAQPQPQPQPGVYPPTGPPTQPPAPPTTGQPYAGNPDDAFRRPPPTWDDQDQWNA